MFRDVFNELLHERRLNRKQFAEQCGIPYTTVVGWTTGGRLPDYMGLIKIADFFGCSIDYLTERCDVYEYTENGAVHEYRQPSEDYPAQACPPIAKDEPESWETVLKRQMNKMSKPDREVMQKALLDIIKLADKNEKS